MDEIYLPNIKQIKEFSRGIQGHDSNFSRPSVQEIMFQNAFSMIPFQTPLKYHYKKEALPISSIFTKKVLMSNALMAQDVEIHFIKMLPKRFLSQVEIQQVFKEFELNF